MCWLRYQTIILPVFLEQLCPNLAIIFIAIKNQLCSTHLQSVTASPLTAEPVVTAAGLRAERHRGLPLRPAPGARPPRADPGWSGGPSPAPGKDPTSARMPAWHQPCGFPWGAASPSGRAEQPEPWAVPPPGQPGVTTTGCRPPRPSGDARGPSAPGSEGACPLPSRSQMRCIALAPAGRSLLPLHIPHSCSFSFQ